MALITLSFLKERVTITDDDRASAYIEDASAIVVDYVNLIDPDEDADSWTETSAPAAVQAVVVQMVQRGVENPMGFTGENLGDHGWQANPRVGVGPYLAPKEKKIIRNAVGSDGFRAVTQEGYLPVEPAVLSDEDLAL